MINFFDLFTSSLFKDISITIAVVSLITVLLISINIIITGRKIRALHLLMTQILDHACLTINSDKNLDVRSNVFLPKPSDHNILEIRFSSSNMQGAPDSTISIEKWQGCTGTAWGYENPVVGDLSSKFTKGSPEWNLTEDQKARTKDLKTILSYPIRHPKDKSLVIGILSFDTKEQAFDYFSSDSVQNTASFIAAEVGLILYSLDIVR